MVVAQRFGANRPGDLDVARRREPGERLGWQRAEDDVGEPGWVEGTEGLGLVRTPGRRAYDPLADAKQQTHRMNPHSTINRALRGSALPHDEARVYARNLEVPSSGGVGTARAIARTCSVFAYLTSRMGTRLTGDPRDVVLREALYAALRAS